MTLRQSEKHKTDKAAAKKTLNVAVLEHRDSPDDLGRFIPLLDKGPGWQLRKQHTSSYGSNKNTPAGPRAEWNKPTPPEPLPEKVQKFVDEHVVKVLEQTEEGREFLKENPDGPKVTA